MSFTSIVKNEVSKLDIINSEAISEISAIIRNGTEDHNNIKIITENASVARRIFNLVKEIYNISLKITVRKGYNYNKNLLYILEIVNEKEKILKNISINDYDQYNIPNNDLVNDNKLKRAYLRGLFLICGSINDPKKSRYHLEFIVDNKEYAKFIETLLNSFRLNSKTIQRENKYMIYIKEAEKIGDFLRIINASNAVLYYEDIRIYRDHKNMTNRLNNCEQANVDRMIQTASEQVKNIELIQDAGGIELLEEKERIVATYRLKYKDASLQELSEIISIETGNKITKSGIHHRFNKIKILANKIRERKID